MAKLTLNTIGSRYGSIDALNANFDAIETALENTLSRDGTIPNTMEVDLDMNSNNIINYVTDVTNSSSLITVGTADTRYVNTTGDTMTGTLNMGNKPIINLQDAINNQDAITLKQVNGLVQSANTGNIVKLREIATATAGQTIFNLSGLTYTPASNNLSVFIQGIKQRLTSAYAETDNNTITFTEAVPVTAVVEFIVNDDI